MSLLKRLTLVIEDGMIEHVFYPGFSSRSECGGDSEMVGRAVGARFRV